MKTIAISFLIAIIFIVVACTKDNNGGGGRGNNNFTPNCTGVTVSFSSQVLPIVQSSCAKSGCHATGSTNGPGQLTNYNEVNSAKAFIRAAIISRAMPKDGSITDNERNLLVCWIDAGAQNN
jgi:uncharacterized membrane protein